MPLTGNILITGGSGTLGHAIARTARQEGWDCRITIYSRSELRQAHMRQRFADLRYVLGDVRDAERLAAAMAGHDLVIHAAAVKRIPEAEQQPVNCYETNITGALNVARAAVLAGVRRVVGISTDKACQAITAYGASKLAMEKLFQAQADGGPIFTLCRYGNVVASNGSVIPLWREQAARGQALTVTSREATRFWMGETEAVRTIEHAAAMQHGTVTIPKMRSLSMAELVEIVAPGARVQVTGFRSVEKLHEDSVSADEQAVETFAHFIAGAGGRGLRYTSLEAPRLTPASFRSMLAEAEAHA